MGLSRCLSSLCDVFVPFSDYGTIYVSSQQLFGPETVCQLLEKAPSKLPRCEERRCTHGKHGSRYNIITATQHAIMYRIPGAHHAPSTRQIFFIDWHLRSIRHRRPSSLKLCGEGFQRRNGPRATPCAKKGPAWAELKMNQCAPVVCDFWKIFTAFWKWLWTRYRSPDHRSHGCESSIIIHQKQSNGCYDSYGVLFSKSGRLFGFWKSEILADHVQEVTKTKRVSTVHGYILLTSFSTRAITCPLYLIHSPSRNASSEHYILHYIDSPPASTDDPSCSGSRCRCLSR